MNDAPFDAGDVTEVYRIGLASNAETRQQAAGQVTRPEMFYPRSTRPVRHGLFCPSIFGRVGEWECHCGTLYGEDLAGRVCDDCGLPVLHLASVRFGYIELNTVVVHPWFVRDLALLLEFTPGALAQLLRYQHWAVVEPGTSPFRLGQLLDENELRQAREQYAGSFEAETGAIACQRLLARTSLTALAAHLRRRLEGAPRSDLRRRLRLVEAILRACPDDPDGWAARMILDCVPVLPPDLRLPPVLGGTRATGRINDIYLDLIYRANRLRRLEDLHAPEVIIRNERRLMQNAVHTLFGELSADRLRRLVVLRLLRRDVDYSARAVAVPDPSLRAEQCALPFAVVVELFRPFILHHIAENSLGCAADRARVLVELFRPARRGCNEEVFRAAGRLYRELLASLQNELPAILGAVLTGRRVIVSFSARLVALEAVPGDDEVVRLHPTAGRRLGLMFRGESVKLHLPLSVEAQAEAAVLLRPGEVETERPKTAGPPNSPAARQSARELFAAARQARYDRFLERQRRRQVAILRKLLVGVGQGVVVRVADCRASSGEDAPAAQRSPLTCRARRGICQFCYGLDPATGRLVEIGTPVGMHAALALAGTTDLDLSRLRALLEGDPDELPPGVSARHLEVIRAQLIRHGREAGRRCARLDGLAKAIRRAGFLTALTTLDPVKVLRRAALRGELEEPIGLHLDAMCGKPIPAGTGFRSEP